MIQRTLVLLKPDAVRRGIMGEIITRFEKIGLKIIAMKMKETSLNLATQHYRKEEIAAKYGMVKWMRLLKFLISGPVVAIVLEGDQSVEVVRKVCGSTEPRIAVPGTLRGDFSHHTYDLSNEQEQSVRNVVHASSSIEDANREISLWFEDSEICTYRTNDQKEHFLD